MKRLVLLLVIALLASTALIVVLKKGPLESDEAWAEKVIPPLSEKDILRLRAIALDWDDPSNRFQQRGQIVALPNDPEGYDGWLRGYGGERWLGRIKGGLANGLWVEWYDDFQKKEEGICKDGVREGPWKFWHSNGQLRWEGEFKAAVENGLWKAWYRNGQQLYEGTFKVGEQDGPWTHWHEHGQGAKKREGVYKNGKEDGHWVDWYENGQMMCFVNFIVGKADGPWTFWHENGRKMSEAIFEDGRMVIGTRQDWNSKGEPITEALAEAIRDGSPRRQSREEVTPKPDHAGVR